ncbi:MAG TPA: DUF5990 family protein [Longimicrobium sp.]|nr:DUF5990 family protein [Longimicrobium sp.]
MSEDRAAAKEEREITLRVVVLDPPEGVAWRMQAGRDELVDPVSAAKGKLVFHAAVRVGGRLADGGPNFLGSFAHGRPDDRFLYVNSGTYAGQADSCWSRRAKVRLGGIGWPLVEQALADPDTVLEARFVGTGKDGGPACAGIQLLDGGWRAVPRGARGTRVKRKTDG